MPSQHDIRPASRHVLHTLSSEVAYGWSGISAPVNQKVICDCAQSGSSMSSYVEVYFAMYMYVVLFNEKNDISPHLGSRLILFSQCDL